MGIRSTLSTSLLKKLYQEEGRSLKEMARILCCSTDTVYKALKEIGIARVRKTVEITKEELEQLYVKEHKTLKEIAAIKSCSTTTISTKLKTYGIPTRNTAIRYIDESVVVRAYTSGNSIGFLVKSLGVSRERIQNILKKHGIMPRKMKEKKTLPMHEIIYMYDKMLLPLGEISRLYNVKSTTLARRLKSRGYVVRGNRKLISTEEIVQYYHRTQSIQATADYFHCSYSMIRKRLLSSGALA